MSTFAQRAAALILLLGAPVALAAQTSRAPTTPCRAVQEFMRAVADSNLTRMAELWGTARGRSSKTHPKDYEKRIVIMQLLLHGVQARTLGDVPVEQGGTAERDHRACAQRLQGHDPNRRGKDQGRLAGAELRPRRGRSDQPAVRQRQAGEHSGSRLVLCTAGGLFGQFDQGAVSGSWDGERRCGGRRRRREARRRSVRIRLAARGERGIEVRHAVADMVKAGAALGDKAADGRVRGGAVRAVRPPTSPKSR